MKLGAAYISGSVGVLSEGLHSFLDVVSAALSYFTIRAAGKPADLDHPFGHGKIETLSSLFESLLLALAAGLILYEGVMHLRHPEPVQYQGVALVVILLSILASYGMYRHNGRVAHATESSAIEVNALHFLADVVAGVGVLLGLALMTLTGWQWIDPLVAFGVGIYILVISAKQVKGALLELSDTQLPMREVHQIQHLLESIGDPTITTHELRTRKSGATRHIDFHLVVCGQMTVIDSHNVCDELESKIKEQFLEASVNIHVEPCEKEKAGCQSDCPHFRRSKKGH